MSGENGLGTGAAALGQGTQDTINGANVPPANRPNEQRTIADQLRGGAAENSFNLDQWMRAAQVEFDTTKAMHAEDAKDGKIDGAVNGDAKALDAHRNLIARANQGMDLLAEDSRSRNEARLNPQPIIINGMQPGDLGYNSYGLANGFMPMGPYNQFTPMGAPMMPPQMSAPQMKVKADGSGVEIIAPDGSVVHTYQTRELAGGQQQAQNLTEAEQKRVAELARQAELAKAEVQKAQLALMTKELSEAEKQKQAKIAIDEMAKANAAHAEINVIMKVNTSSQFLGTSPSDTQVDADRVMRDNGRFIQDWLKDEREFNQKRIQEHERVSLDLYQGDHEMLRRVAQRQMEQDIRNNAGWVRVYQRAYAQQEQAYTRDWSREQDWQRREMTQDNRMIRKSFWENILEAGSNVLAGGFFSRLTGSLFGDNILRAQNRNYDRVVRNNQQHNLRVQRQNNQRGGNSGLWG